MLRTRSRVSTRHPRRALLLALLATSMVLLTSVTAMGGDRAPQTIARFAWGSGTGELGREVPEEGAPEGPMSFALDPSGGLVVLDQVNWRLVFVGADGQVERQVAVTDPTFQDVAIGAAGELILMDRLGDPRIVVLSSDGKAQHTVPLEGEGIPEGGGAMRLLARPDGVWVDWAHERSVHVLDDQLSPVQARAQRGGQPGLGGRYWAQAKVVGPTSVEVWTVDATTDVIEAHRVIDLGVPLALITGLVADAQGRVALAVEIREEDPESFAVTRATTRLLALDRDLSDRGSVETPPLHGYLEQFKVIDMDEQGRIVQLVVGEDAVEVLRWTP